MPAAIKLVLIIISKYNKTQFSTLYGSNKATGEHIWARAITVLCISLQPPPPHHITVLPTPMEILGTAGSPFIRLSRPLVYCSPHSSIKPWMTCSIHQSRRWSNVQPDALADILEHSASLAVGVRIHDACLVKFTQSTGVHLQLPLQLRDCRRRLLIALLKRGFHTLCLLPVNVGVIHRRQTQILVNVLCAIIWQANIIGKSLTTMLHSPAWQFSTSGYV